MVSYPCNRIGLTMVGVLNGFYQEPFADQLKENYLWTLELDRLRWGGWSEWVSSLCRRFAHWSQELLEQVCPALVLLASLAHAVTHM